jgi:Bacterial Ig-like domain (group 3)/Bacterial Ig-like domain
VDPVDHSVLISLDPVDLAVRAEALSGLRVITVTVDGNFLTSFNFPDASVTGYAGSTTWTPAPDLPDGAHIFQTSATDWADQVQTVPFTSTIYVDTLPPTVDVSPTVYTSTHLISNWGVNLSGPVSDLAGVSSVQIALQGSGAWYPASVVGNQWSYQRMPETLPDGQVFNLDVQATDLGGNTTQVTRPITADLVPPSPITITLSYVNSSGALTPVLAGQTIYDVLDPTVQIAWTPASDGSGLRRYWAGLSQQDSPDLASLTPVDPNGTLQVSQGTVEAQAYTAYVVSEDIYGNLSWNHLGPIYTDTPMTPDLITMPQTDIYHGWMDSGESQIGFNRILSDTLPLGLSLNHAQKIYLSWDAEALRLAWLGADWDSDGDLFIYLKTGSGAGTDQAYNPYPATAGDTLTLPFAADTLVWVTGSQFAQIKRWDGAAWSDALPGGLPPADFRFTAHYPASLTDLYLPFDLLGITDPATTPLDMIAFGSQKDALRVWAVFPILNPHDSPLLSKLLHRLPDQHHLVMVNAFHWDNLGLQQSPNLSRFLDVDVRGLLRTEPIGRITDSRVNSLYMMLSPYLFPSNATPLIGDGQVIHYTLYYINASGAAMPNEHLLLKVTSTGPLELPGGTLIVKPDGTTGYYQVLDLGPMQLGDLGSVEFTGVVNFGPTLAQYHLCLQEHPGDPVACQDLHDKISTARIDADLMTSASEDVVINRYIAEHTLVVAPPVDVAVLSAEGQPAALKPLDLSGATAGLAPAALEQALAQPPIFVRSGVNTLQGTAVDPSGVASVKVQILDPYGDTTDTSCPVDAPMSGQWSCTVDLSEASNEARYFARAQATNSFGYTSGWSAWRVLVIDTLPPIVSLDSASQSALSTVIGRVATTISGEIQDNGQVKNVDVCLNPADQQGDASCQTVELSTNNVLTGNWSTTLLMPLGVDYASRTLSIYGWDAAGNRSTQSLDRTFWFDTLPPSVELTTQLFSVSLVDYSEDPQPILAGRANDGSGQVEIVVRMTSPASGTQRTVIPVEDNQWSYIPEIRARGVYSLSLQARDAAGNLTSLGSWTLQVTDNYRYWLPFISN